MAYDGLAIVQHEQNTDSCISVKDIRRILSGEVKRWDEIFPNSKLGEISIVFDNKRSSTVHFVEDSILGGKPITAPGAFAVDSTAEVVGYVEKHKEAIGLIGSNWLIKKSGFIFYFSNDLSANYLLIEMKKNDFECSIKFKITHINGDKLKNE